jgi:peptidyl-tRNA hydrolase, PTH1 family
MRILVGLGNPGQQYATTRHNVGWMALDRIADRERLRFRTERRFRADAVETTVPGTGERLLLLKPLTYMNLSGEAVRAALDFFKLEPADVLVIYDEMHLPLGFVRVRPGGSAAGHNGIKSIIAHLGTQDFPRVRIGVDAPVGDPIGHVLSTFRPDEWPAVHEAVDLGIEAVYTAFRDGVLEAMSRFNRRATPPPEPPPDE